MSFEITKEQYESLSKAQQSLFKQEGDGPFVMQEPEDATGLKKKLDTVLGEKKKLQDQVNDYKTQVDTLENDIHEIKTKADPEKNRADIDALNSSWQKKLDKQVGELNEKLSARENQIIGLTSGATAGKMAAEIAVQGSASVLEPHIAKRLRTEFAEDGSPKTVVLGTDGSPSAITLDELRQEFMTNQAFAPLVVGSKASGVGHQGGGGGGAPDRKQVTRSKWDGMDHASRAAHSKAGGIVVDD